MYLFIYLFIYLFTYLVVVFVFACMLREVIDLRKPNKQATYIIRYSNH